MHKRTFACLIFTSALTSPLWALWHWKAACFATKIFPHMHACIILQSTNPQVPPDPSPSLFPSFRVSLVGITWSPRKKPNQTSTISTNSFILQQNSTVKILPLRLRLIINPYLRPVNHNPGRSQLGVQGRCRSPPLGEATSFNQPRRDGEDE